MEYLQNRNVYAGNIHDNSIFQEQLNENNNCDSFNFGKRKRIMLADKGQ